MLLKSWMYFSVKIERTQAAGIDGEDTGGRCVDTASDTVSREMSLLETAEIGREITDGKSFGTATRTFKTQLSPPETPGP